MTMDGKRGFCKICLNRGVDANHGVICGLTNAMPTFELTCDSFIEDKVKVEAKESGFKEAMVLANEASKIIRLINYFLDMVFIFIFFMGIGYLLSILFPYLEIFRDEESIFIYLMDYSIVLFYYLFWELSTGRTLAKYFTRTKVTTYTGEKPSAKSLLVRSLLRFIPFDPITFLISSSDGFHDRFSKTKVIRSNIKKT